MAQPLKKRKRAEDVDAPKSQQARPLSAVEARKAARLRDAQQVSTPPPAPGEVEAEGPMADGESSIPAAHDLTPVEEVVEAETAPGSGWSTPRSAILHRAESRPRDVVTEGRESAHSREEAAQREEMHHRARRRARGKERARFVDEECVSRWTAVEKGKRRNVVRDSQGLWIGLQEGETLVLAGTSRLTVAKGAIEVSGARVESSSGGLDIVAPPGHPLPTLRALSSSEIASADVPIDTSCFWAAVHLADLATGVEGLDKPWTSTGARPLHAIASTSASPHGSSFTLITEVTPDVGSVRLPQSWSDALGSLSPTDDRFVAVVEGSKRTGKSTFAAHLVNALLHEFARVAVLDLDPGQPLFGPPTLVSLHVVDAPVVAPAHARQGVPVKCHYLGATTAKDDPARFLAAVTDLVETYRLLDRKEDPQVARRWRRKSDRKEVADVGGRRTDLVPLVVNTMGWTKGLGADLLAQVAGIVGPTHAFTFDATCVAQGCQIVRLEPVGETPLSLRLTPHDLRTLSLLSYFYAHLPASMESDPTTPLTSRWTVEVPLVALRPYTVPWSGPSSPFAGVSAMTGLVDPEHIGFALNGAVVALVTVSGAGTGDDGDQALKQIHPTPSPAESSCLGLALIRAVDPATRSLQLLTPIPHDVLTRQPPRSVLIVRGSDPDLPLAASTDWTDPSNGAEGLCGVGWEDVPYLSAGGATAVVGARRTRVRRNVMRRAQVAA